MWASDDVRRQPDQIGGIIGGIYSIHLGASLPEAGHNCSEPAQQAHLEDEMIAWLDALTIPPTMTPASAAQVPNGRHATQPVAGRVASSPTR